MKWLLIFLSLWGQGVAATPLFSDVTGPVCRERLQGLPDFGGVSALPGLTASLTSGRPSAELQSALRKWSGDFLVKLILEIEQDYRSVCPDSAKINLAVEFLQRAYLGGLGLDETKIPSNDVETFFRGLLVLHDDREVLKKKIGTVKGNLKGMELLARLYGKAEKVDSVLVLGAAPADIKNLKTFLTQVSDSSASGPFWDSAAIYKVLVTTEAGVAAYIPETATLVISEELLAAPTVLTRVVLLHELAHAADRRAWFRNRRRWTEEFAPFSGWTKSAKGEWSVKVRKLKTEHEDILTRLSHDSAFSILPDPVILGPGPGNDGFVMSKSYDQSLARNDPSEDTADSIAVYRWVPERFCFQGKNIAPRKFNWIALNLFPDRPKIRCEKASDR